MAKEFKKDKNYVFTKKLFVKNMGRKSYKDAKEWVNRCNGRIVVIENSLTSNVGVFGISPEWCKEVNDR